MNQININGLKIEYDRDRDLFNYLLKLNGVTKKKFCEKFGLSYSYVNAWGSSTKEKDIKYPNWVLIYLKDVMYFKVQAIKVKMNLDKLYDELEAGKNLTEIFIELNKSGKDVDTIFIPNEIIEKENNRIIKIKKGK